jgi:hypothetical protein
MVKFIVLQIDIKKKKNKGQRYPKEMKSFPFPFSMSAGKRIAWLPNFSNYLPEAV